MTLKILGSVAFGAALLWSCAATSNPSAATSYAAARAASSRVLCDSSSEVTIGTATRVGDAVVTAKHVIEACRGRLIPVYQSAAQTDFAILTLGQPGVCRDAEPGEGVVFAGYPGTRRIGGERLDAANRRLETDTGVVDRKDVTVASLGGSPISLRRIVGLTASTSTAVRGGYSGGPVVSAVDGRVVGITNAAATDSTLAYFTPITLICDQIRKELARE